MLDQLQSAEKMIRNNNSVEGQNHAPVDMGTYTVNTPLNQTVCQSTPLVRWICTRFLHPYQAKK